jgi:hypothetical protein
MLSFIIFPSEKYPLCIRVLVCFCSNAKCVPHAVTNINFLQAWNGAGLSVEAWSKGAKIVCLEDACECTHNTICVSGLDLE